MVTPNFRRGARVDTLTHQTTNRDTIGDPLVRKPLDGLWRGEADAPITVELGEKAFVELAPRSFVGTRIAWA